jgi:ADP-ribosylation factor-like protein 2
LISFFFWWESYWEETRGKARRDGVVDYHQEGEEEREGNAHPHGVRILTLNFIYLFILSLSLSLSDAVSVFLSVFAFLQMNIFSNGTLLGFLEGGRFHDWLFHWSGNFMMTYPFSKLGFCLIAGKFVRGLDNAGKTTIVKRINGEDTSSISPTLGFNIKTMQYNSFRLNIWDVGGQKTLRSYWRNYYEQTDGMVWVVDSSDLRRLNDCRHELHGLLKQEKLAGASLLIFANKQDIKGAMTPQEIARVLNLEVMDGSRHWQIIGCSAVTGEGLLAGFDWLVSDIGSRIYMLE